MGDAPRLLVVEDDRSLRAAIAAALRQEGYVVRSTSSSRRAEELLESFLPDLAVLDIRFPEGPDGFALARSMRGTTDAPFVFVTAVDRLEDRLSGFELGADDYLVKPFAMPELLARVRVSLRRAGRRTAGTISVGPLLLDPEARAVRYGDEPVELSPTEFDLLLALARHPGRVLSKRRLLALVWDFESYDDNLVEVYVSALRRKLEQHGPRIVHTVRGAGYVLRT